MGLFECTGRICRPYMIVGRVSDSVTRQISNEMLGCAVANSIYMNAYITDLVSR